jgi:hypothetical protein
MHGIPPGLEIWRLLVNRILVSGMLAIVSLLPVAGVARAQTFCSGICQISFGPDDPESMSQEVEGQSASELSSNCQEFCSSIEDALSCGLISQSCS